MTRTLLCAAALAALTLPAAAQDPATGVAEIIVTATRLPAVALDTPGARVIDEDDIQRRGAVFAADVLADVPGLSVYRSGPGGVTSVRMRGAGQDKSLILVDGVPLNDASQPAGGFDFAGLDLGDVRRIEVLSGPQSSLWGSDAIGGVIAFTTREPDGLAAELEAGAYNTRRGRISAGVADADRAVGVYASRFETDGVSAADGGLETDPSENTTVGLNARKALSAAFSLDARLRWSDSFAQLDGFGPVDDPNEAAATENLSGHVRLSADRVAGLDHQLTLAASRIDRDSRGAFPAVYGGDRRIVRWQAMRSDRDAPLDYTFGLEREEVEADLNGNLGDQTLNAAFGVARWAASERLALTLGLRHDDISGVGAETTGRASAAFELGGGWVLSGAYGTGFKAPSVAQALCDFCFVLPGTMIAALRPESARGGEIALAHASPDGRWTGRATLYRLEVEDQIDGFFDPGTFEFYYVNIDRTRTNGLELEGRADLGRGLDLTLAYAFTDAVDEATGVPILRVPEHAGSATLAWAGERLSGALTVRAESEMPDAAGTRDGFVVANLTAGYALTSRVDLTLRAENLGDAGYQQLHGFGEPGRSAWAGVRLRW
ncbi:TonB-dependent receptor [Brevundimonas sp. 2R-24]|uniref:TonB-dependent receptor n=1 Tax=Peiella sedimenti TaxID=3061083 RepID=A0ABT8SKG8_9CAUL|nr:TonB-dependent receptor [Caulobacteraceae bacterium XZ-24]